ncbi:MAG: hypothetical protein ACR2JF_13845 [Iamia sp.]
MKVAGTIVLCLGLIAGFLLAMVPVSVVIFGSSGSCGPPLLRVIAQQETSDPNDQALIDLCEDRSADRLPYAGAAVVAGVLIGGGLLVAGRGRGTEQSAPPPGPPPAAPPR